MALATKWAERNEYKENLVIRINRRKNTINAEGYDGIYFEDEIPADKHQYYCVHSENDWDKIIAIKRERGLTCNFWGTIVTDAPIDFGKEDWAISARIVERED